jgi:hypothetical protein
VESGNYGSMMSKEQEEKDIEEEERELFIIEWAQNNHPHTKLVTHPNTACLGDSGTGEHNL